MFNLGVIPGESWMFSANEWSLKLETGVRAYAIRSGFGSKWRVGYEE